ncbi:phage capsid protein [Frankia sp. AgB32]|uniref:phage capsid protein n=1 Tax=Frankia sp. AgB32 TaxID=631119 RepID=UPI00200F2DC2|nr:phage capsid protein [Frankia sp. AgB32]MCK9896962.1 phage capsid protein [Frankia sp. AgB32]
MAINRFVPIIWTSALMSSLKKSLVYADLCNTDYEGEIQSAGNTVKITSISRPTINSYTRNSNINYEELTDAQRSLVVDQEKYWAVTVDDVDKAQAKADVVSEAMSEAAYALADTIDQYIAALYTQAQTANRLGTVAVTNTDIAYTQIRLLKLRLDQANVPQEGRWLVCPPWYHSLLLENQKFVSYMNSQTTEPLYNGQVGRALGFDIRVSNNAPLVTGDDYAVMAGTNRAITFARQLTKTEAGRSEQRIGDWMRGIAVYGSKVIRPEGIATMVASMT